MRFEWGAMRRHKVTAASLLLAVLLSMALSVWRWESPGPRASGDTWQYTRLTYSLLGDSKSEAASHARSYICRDWRSRGAPASYLAQCSKTGNGVERYNRIFRPRVGFPLVAAALHPMLGDMSFAATTLLFSVLCGMLCFAFVRVCRGGVVAALLATSLVYVLPSGFWLSRVLAEGAMMAGMLLAVVGAALAMVRGRVLTGAALMATGVCWTFTVKNANGIAEAGVMTAASLIALAATALGRRDVRTPLVLTSTAAALTAGLVLVQRLLSYPSINETLQDTFTSHFRTGRPLVPDPWSRLFALQRDVLVPYLEDVAWNGLGVSCFAIAVALLFWRLPRAAPFVVLTGVTGAAVVFMHPVHSEIPRLALPLWIPIVLGLPMALANDRGVPRADDAGTEDPSAEQRPADAVT